ncbi:DEAD/DEAH box helicase [Aquimarina sp. ERC-38]|uniref:DEAD/DEAH box helicase n=1 Tax=Aquimarina sp. ERC-38 TaxID=2949996 RepID=UPI0022476008|nr:DEAD/DEAH box helicase [Aquimarina sp. ERC-38]UZO79551.1 DEAD/DEAH box helicase [Aquimarina sp. ERC-38]
MNFLDLGVTSDLVKGLKEIGIVSPSAIQQKAIPVLLENTSDMVARAQTGTGKTAAFGIPLLSHINPKIPNVQALVLAPTRELCQQIAKQFFKFTKYSDKIYVEAVYGGEKIDRQLTRLKRTTHVIVATPGRLIDLADRGIIDLAKIRFLVLDEADEMLSMGFKKELTTILEKTTSQKSTWLFSATLPKTLQEIIKRYVQPNATHITIDKGSVVNRKITHQYVQAEEIAKTDILTYFLKSRKNDRGLIFTRTKDAARKLHKVLLAKGYPVGLLEGDMHQKDRDKVMRAFLGKKVNLLISTDVAARGIDVQNLAFVLHFQLPDQIDYYTHRSGRTARGGKEGLSLALVSKEEFKFLRAIENELKIRFSQIR